jgi:hypothetical protein
MIIAANIENEKEYELRIDMLSLVEHFLLQKELHSTIIFYAEIILKMIYLLLHYYQQTICIIVIASL